jgi:hypothetical protein
MGTNGQKLNTKLLNVLAAVAAVAGAFLAYSDVAERCIARRAQNVSEAEVTEVPDAI